MSYETMRRSTRVPKELAILLTGSDMDGKGFSEMTKTVLLSRHGAGIISTYKLSAEQEIIIRYLDTNKEALVRVVGRIGSEGDVYTYGVAFADPSNVDFWGIDFAPVSEVEKTARRVPLECGNCKRVEIVEHSDVESDVFIINEGIVRFCKQCGDSTLWKRASEVPEEQEQPVLVGATKQVNPSSFAGATGAGIDLSDSSMSSASSTMIEDPPEAAPIAAPVAAPALPPEKKPVPLENRRKHPRTKVNYKACIRRSGFPDDIVTCEDMSRGGVCFRSRKQYFERTAIEVAVPYAPGGQPIFVPAEIAWVQELPKEKQYKCGVSYRPTSRSF
ncbi:MAG TPA: PilZ domain-containing protein [Candidatus Methylomirabilis sp.]|nr:PilZ domain-containing protein [Candidatus Methylomirabilis sp.]